MGGANENYKRWSIVAMEGWAVRKTQHMSHLGELQPNIQKTFETTNDWQVIWNDIDRASALVN